MNLLSARQKLVASNIANTDTPGYKTKDIDFRAEFAQQMQEQECGGPQTSGPQTIEPDGLPVKADGNNVSLDRESRMLAENWRGLGVLYVCPIRALLNNLDARLSRYCTLLGRRSALWHGDVAAGLKKAVLRDPPDCLLTTPESLEVMLVSQKTDAAAL